jgi:hypothetical protein
MSGGPGAVLVVNRSGLAEHADDDFPKLVILQSVHPRAVLGASLSRSTSQLPGIMVGRFALLSRSRSSKENWVLLQSGDSSEQATASKTMTKVPVSTAAENVKAFVAGGFGGVCAVLVGSWARCTALSRFSLV